MHMLKMGPVGRKKFLELLGDAGQAEAIAMSHLERSNEELRAALAADARDEISRQALSENEVILKRKYARLDSMQHAHSTTEEVKTLGGDIEQEAHIADQLYELVGQLKRKAASLQDEVQSIHSMGYKFAKVDCLLSAGDHVECGENTQMSHSMHAKQNDLAEDGTNIVESRPKQAKQTHLPLLVATDGHDNVDDASSAETSTQLHTLLQQTKRKAAELDADVLICSLSALDLSDSAKRFCS